MTFNVWLCRVTNGEKLVTPGMCQYSLFVMEFHLSEENAGAANICITSTLARVDVELRIKRTVEYG